MTERHNRGLLGLSGLSRSEITRILDTAQMFSRILDRPVPSVPTLRGWSVVNLFFEPSTRTRISFELAEKRMGADIINFSASISSVNKGETLLDTARNILAMKVDAIVMRHRASGAPHFLAKHVNVPIVNAGDGAHEHPTQALLDMLTIRQKLGKLEGLKIAIVGDIRHSRVARSDIWGMTTMGAEVTLCGPPTLMPKFGEHLPARITYSLDEALADADVVYALRIQRERQDGGLFPSIREYVQNYGITQERLDVAKPDSLIMHPGPINRGWELSHDVADDPDRSVILDQVTNGIAVRMAVLFLAAGREPESINSGARA